jgi:hypothetical protein
MQAIIQQRRRWISNQKRNPSHKLRSEEEKPNKAKNQHGKANPNRQEYYQDRRATLSLGSS